MAQTQVRTLDDLVRHLGRYPENAFVFIREGLGWATEQVHGPETPAHRKLHEYLAEANMDWSDLANDYYSGSLPEALYFAINAAGGWEKMNRHISGRELSWGLRGFALRRWGLMARLVLESWNIRGTIDFGRIVFGFIYFDLMQKQPGDSIQDFEGIFDFEEAFDGAYSHALRNSESETVVPDQE